MRETKAFLWNQSEATKWSEAMEINGEAFAANMKTQMFGFT